MERKKKIDFSKEVEAPILIKFIKNRFIKKLSTMIFVIGLRGSGKSSVCQRLAQLLKEKREEIEIFLVDSLLDLLKSIRKSKEGDVIIIEEISVLFPSRRAMSGENIAISKVLDTIRKKQLIIFTNCPIWKSVDSNMKSAGDVIIETLKIDKKEKIVHSKFHRLQINPFTGEPYRHTFQNNCGYDINRIFTRMPDLNRWNEYEKDKDQFMDNLYKTEQLKQERKILKEQKELGINKENIDMNNLSKQFKRVLYLKDIENLKQEEIAEQMGLSQSRISQIIDKIHKISENT